VTGAHTLIPPESVSSPLPSCLFSIRIARRKTYERHILFHPDRSVDVKAKNGTEYQAKVNAYSGAVIVIRAAS
jgi:hypothetical protein